MTLLCFITNKDATERDIKGDENEIKQFPRNIGYKQRGNTKCNRSRLIRRKLISIASPRRGYTSKNELKQRDTIEIEQGVGEDEEEEEEEKEEQEGEKDTVYESGKNVKASGLSKGLRPWPLKANQSI